MNGAHSYAACFQYIGNIINETQRPSPLKKGGLILKRLKNSGIVYLLDFQSKTKSSSVNGSTFVAFT